MRDPNEIADEVTRWADEEDKPDMGTGGNAGAGGDASSAADALRSLAAEKDDLIKRLDGMARAPYGEYQSLLKENSNLADENQRLREERVSLLADADASTHWQTRALRAEARLLRIALGDK